MSARGVLKMGVRWHIGDGKSVCIKDPWLPLSSSCGAFSAQNVLSENGRVSLLINEDNHSWNPDIILCVILGVGRCCYPLHSTSSKTKTGLSILE
jgi:hypothetical protein